MEHFPIFLDLKGRRVVVVGGGAEAARKAELLISAGADLLVVAALMEPALSRLVGEGRCRRAAGPFHPALLDGAVLAIAASGNERLDDDVAATARARGVLVNVVDRAAASSFVMPAILDRSPVLVAVSTGGASPTLAQLIRARIEAALPARIGALARLARALRPIAAKRLPDAASRRLLWRRLLDGSFAELALAGAEREARAVFGRELESAERAAEPRRRAG